MPEIVNTSQLQDFQIEDDTRDTVIAVRDVSMIFNMASEQLNSLKEYAVQLAKGKLFFEGFTALDHINFEVKRGDVFGIVGTNGSGKSTLLKIVAGVLEPSKGECEINGKIAPLIELGAGFDIELSARENIYLNGALLGYSRKFIDENFDRIVEFAEIEKFLDMPLKNYSSGMVARIAFAIATVIVPEILIVDEVLSVGDFMFQKKCEDRIASLIEEHGTTVLIVSHSNDQIQKLCNKAIWIEKGHTRLIGDAQHVCGAYGVLGGRVGSPESEKRVFDEFVAKMNSKNNLVEDAYSMIAGDDFFSTACKGVLNAWRDTSIGAEAGAMKPAESVMLCVATTHANTIIPLGLAGALRAPVLPVRTDVLPDATEQALRVLRPKRVFINDTESDFAALSQELTDLGYGANIETLGNNAVSEFSLQVLRCMEAQNVPMGDTAVMVDFFDNAAAFAIGPLVYRNALPVLMTSEGVWNASTPFVQVAELLKNAGVTKALAIGSVAQSEYVQALRDAGFEVETILGDTQHELCCAITTYVAHAFADDTETASQETVGEDAVGLPMLGVSSCNISHWVDLLAAPCVCGVKKYPLLLEDSANLDSISTSLVVIDTWKPKHLLIFGKSGLSVTDVELLASAAQRHYRH